MFDVVINFISNSSAITLFIFALLSIYIVAIIWVFLYRFMYISSLVSKEEESAKSLYMGSLVLSKSSLLYPCTKKRAYITKEILNACKNNIMKEATIGLTLISIVATTSPFIGLFGTVISILETFSQLGVNTNSSLAVVAPAISEALVATAAGIFVSVPAYSFHLILKRKSFELVSIVETEIDLLLSSSEHVE